MVLCSIGLVSGLGYNELVKAEQENATVRIDHAARTATQVLRLGTGSALEAEFDASGRPVALRLPDTANALKLRPDATLDRLVAGIAQANQGAASFYRWSEAMSEFELLATSFDETGDVLAGKAVNDAGYDASVIADITIRPGHPGYANLFSGKPFTGDVPVAGRNRLTYLTPVLDPGGRVAGALAVDVGWSDGLKLAENRLRIRTVSIAALIMVGVVLIGSLLLYFELRPLRELASTADQLAAGNQPGHVPYCDRRDEIGDLAHGLERVTDLQDKLHKLAYTDPVTTAGNRSRYFADLTNVLKETRSGTYCASLMHLDFRGFTKINDIFGQQIGNRVLLQTFARLANIFGPSAHISRISGDDFCIILPFDSGGSIAEDYAIKAIEMLSAPFHINENEIRVEPRIGIALLPQDARDVETAHRVAGLALRAARDSEECGYKFFTAPLNERVQTEMLTETLLRAALKTRQLTLHYQPQISPGGGHLIGLEALIRWPDAKRGFIPPVEFIPIAERTGLILELGTYVLELACRQASAWKRSGMEFGHVSVNVSPLQFRQPSFARTVRQILESHSLPAHMLCLEVTENVFVDTSEQLVLDILSELETIGVQLSLDDFGSGYSSLIYLHSLPFRELKIDRAFLVDADQHPQKEHLFQAIVGLGRSLGLRVIAEGAETAGEFALTAEHGCDGVQGYYFSPAVAAPDVPDIIRKTTRSDIGAAEPEEKRRA